MGRRTNLRWRAGGFLLAAGLCLATAPLVSAAPAMPVTACGQVVTGAGYLTSDLNCPAMVGYAVQLAAGGTARLDLAGFTLTANRAVHCFGACTISSSSPGGGLAHDGSSGGEVSVGIFGSHVRTEDILLSGFEIGVFSTSKVQLKRSRVEHAAVEPNAAVFGGDHPRTRIKLIDSEVVGAGVGICVRATSAILKGSTITGCGTGVSAGSVRVAHSTISDHAGDGVVILSGRVEDRRARLLDSEFSGNGQDGLSADCTFARCLLRLKRMTISGNGRHGVFAREARERSRRTRIRDSQLAGNGVGASCGIGETCADVATLLEPAIDSPASCGVSYLVDSGFPGSSWLACSGD